MDNDVIASLLKSTKDNLLIEHDEDDADILEKLMAAIAYAEEYQRKPEGYYLTESMRATTRQAIILLASHFYESRDGSTGGFFGDSVQAVGEVWNATHRLLRMKREVVI